MPAGVYKNYKCQKFHGKFTPQEHQKFVKKYFLASPHKGLLLYHKLGSGKTCSSIIIADALLSGQFKQKGISTVYILTPGSLRQGWIGEYCGVCGENTEMLQKMYTFITYNYNVAKSLPDDFNNSLIIIDEVHNFINNVKNRAKNAMAIYTKITDCSNCRVLALSGTPIYNNIYEWSILGNLLKPGTFPDIFNNNILNTTNFMMLFNIKADGELEPKHPLIFNDWLSGIISYFPGVSDDMYPQLIEEPIVKVPMSEEQEAKYWPAFTTEQDFIRRGMPKESLRLRNPANYEWAKTMYIMSKKRILSRQPSNFYYPEYAFNKTKDAVYPKGWVKKEYFNDKQLKNIYSPKMAVLFTNILDNFRSKHMVFTFFKENSGVNIMKSLCDMCGISCAVFSGDLSDPARRNLLSKFNNVSNRYGEIIKVIFVTDAGAEGITLLETGHIHILESDVRENKIQQVIGRVVRYKSHINMPKELQKVHLWRYWSVSAHSGDKLSVKIESFNDKGEIIELRKTIKTGDTIDEILYIEGKKRMETINSFIQLLINNSIENNF